MAIDSRLKRQSVAGLKPFKKAPLPDGTIAAVDRVLIACLYCGIAIQAAVPLALRASIPRIIEYVPRDVDFRNRPVDITFENKEA